MSTPRTRATFLDVAQIVERSRCYAGRAHALLMQARRAKDLDDRSRSFLDLVEAQRVELERAIDRAVTQTPARVVETGEQYSVDPWEVDPALPRSTSIEDVTRWIIEIDERLLATYRALAERSESEEVSEFFQGLAELVRAFDRRLARESQDAYDV